ncbi:hypothetical protein Dsin_002086 [Dipteronia sinensis]|uniref:Uncharacterized protein n=1 Tax=Dipteronia sinensis TaxID=43782 RepID=A0AAE0B6H3_9ROSI|nr:hypothetical protein Dsin_002086 [Dipteronia sinensis]
MEIGELDVDYVARQLHEALNRKSLPLLANSEGCLGGHLRNQNPIVAYEARGERGNRLLYGNGFSLVGIRSVS